MNARQFFAQILVIVGLAALLLGALDPLEGCIVILAGSALVYIGARLRKSRYHLLLGAALVLVLLGVAAMFVLGRLGGVGGRSQHSIWWLLLILPYPIGWLMALAGTVALVGKGWHRVCLCCAVVLVASAVAALITLGLYRHHVDQSTFRWVVGLPYLTGLTLALIGAILWIVRSFRAAEPADRAPCD
jgi:hypothetical protein